MRINQNPNAGHKQNFGMAIYADHKAIGKLKKIMKANDDDTMYKLNRMISEQLHKKPDIFLSTDEMNNLTAKIGFSPEIKEKPKFKPINVIEEAVSFVNSIESRLIAKINNQLIDTSVNKGTNAAIDQVVKRLEMDI